MNYYKYTDNKNNLIGIGTNSNGIKISKVEYDHLLNEIHLKADWEEKIYVDPTTINLCPPEWRQEILQRIQERKAQEPKPTDDISDAEFADMIQEVL